MYGIDTARTEKIIDLQNQMVNMEDVPYWQRPLMFTSEQLPQQLQKFTADPALKATGVAMGMQVGRTAGTPGLLPGQAIGAAAGGAIGYQVASTASSIKFNFEQAFGEAYGELRDFRDDKGMPLSTDTLRGASLIYAAVSSGLELVGLDAVLNKMLGGRATKKTIATLLKGETGRQVLAKWGKTAAKVGGLESITEMLQEGALMGTGAAATKLDFGAAQWPTPEKALERLLYAAEAGFWSGSMISGGVTAPGAAVDFYDAKYRANRFAEWWDSTTDLITSIKNVDEDPDGAAEVLGDMTDNDALPDAVYVPAEQVTAYFQSKGMTEEDIAQIAPNVVSALQEAYENDTDVALTMADIRRIGGPTREFYDSIAAHIKATRDGLSLSEISDLQRATKESRSEYERLANSQEAQDSDPLISRIQNDMLAGGIKPHEAKAHAIQHAAVFNTLVKRGKMTITPTELYEKFNARFERKRTAVEELLNVSVLSSKIEAIKEGAVPTEREVMGPSVLEFLQGERMAPHSDLLAMDLDKYKAVAAGLGLKQKPFIEEGRQVAGRHLHAAD